MLGSGMETGARDTEQPAGPQCGCGAAGRCLPHAARCPVPRVLAHLQESDRSQEEPAFPLPWPLAPLGTNLWTVQVSQLGPFLNVLLSSWDFL